MYRMNSAIQYIVLSIATAGFLAACSPTLAQRGNMLQNYQIEQVVPTVHTRSDILRLLGSPTTTAPFDENTWYYIGQETEKRGILDPEVIAERIVVVQFDQDGIVQQVKDQDTARLDVPIDRARTPTHGNEVTAIQQMLGNLGKFNPPSE